MEFNQETVKRIRGLIVFAALVVLCFWRYDIVLDGINFVIHVIYPFILRGAIAFVLNVPMNFFQRHLFNPDRIKGHKYLKKMARPVSMLLALCSVIGVIALVMLVLIPQLGDTFVNLGRNIQAFIPRLQEWATSIFRDNPDIVSWINGLEFNWNTQLFYTRSRRCFKFYDHGGKKHCQRTYDFLHCFCVCHLYPASERKADKAV